MYPTLTQCSIIRLAVFHAAGEILNTGNSAIVLSLRFVQLHPGPKTSGELGAAAETQRSNLNTQQRITERLSTKNVKNCKKKMRMICSKKRNKYIFPYN